MAGGVMPDGALRRTRGLTAELNRRCRCVTLDRAAPMQTLEAEAALVRAPEIARFDPGPAGAFMGYDFHLEAGGPKLIEVNTNAGGAFLNALLARALWACCGETAPGNAVPPPGGFEDAVWHMFEAEWRRQRVTGAPASITIVDDEPRSQFLHLEFLLARRLFEARVVGPESRLGGVARGCGPDDGRGHAR